MTDNLKFNVSPFQRLLLLLLTTVLGYIVASVIAYFMQRGGLTASKLFISTVVQDVLLFILPAFVTAIFITRQPADFLGVSRQPGINNIILAALCLLVAIPAMNMIIDWNAHLQLPDSMSDIERWMKRMETETGNTIAMMVNGESVMSLVMLILVVGIMAGFSEELFFRGTIQRMMITARVNAHVAIWITAIIFSAIHMQFYGFVPRMLLGAMFGYMAWWSGSLWPAITGHITNNTVAAIVMWMKARGASSPVTQIDTIGADSFSLTAASLIFTGACLLAIYISCKKLSHEHH